MQIVKFVKLSNLLKNPVLQAQFYEIFLICYYSHVIQFVDVASHDLHGYEHSKFLKFIFL